MSTKTNSEKFLGFVVSGFVSGFGVWSIEQDKIIKNAKMNYSKKKSNLFAESRRDFSDLIHVNNWQEWISTLDPNRLLCKLQTEWLSDD